MVLIDSSAWIEYLRDTGSPACARVDEIIARAEAFATTDVVVLELLAGARNSRHRSRLWALLDRASRFLPVRPVFDYDDAATICSRCRRGGYTPRQLTDCLIAAVAISAAVPLLHSDRDFTGIAEHTELAIA
jgi:predicted nucleic acid-binding protein